LSKNGREEVKDYQTRGVHDVVDPGNQKEFTETIIFKQETMYRLSSFDR